MLQYSPLVVTNVYYSGIREYTSVQHGVLECMYLSPAGHSPPVSSCLWRDHPETAAKDFSSCS